MTPLDEARSLLRRILEDKSSEIGLYWRRRIDELLSNYPMASPTSAAPSTSTTKYPPDFPATVTKDLMQHSVASPTPLTDAWVIKDKRILDGLGGLEEIVEARFARDLERKLAEVQALLDRVLLLRTDHRDFVRDFSHLCAAIDEAMRGKL